MTPPTTPWRPLALLAVAVLCAHLWALWDGPWPWHPPGAGTARDALPALRFEARAVAGTTPGPVTAAAVAEAAFAAAPAEPSTPRSTDPVLKPKPALVGIQPRFDATNLIANDVAPLRLQPAGSPRADAGSASTDAAPPAPRATGAGASEVHLVLPPPGRWRYTLEARRRGVSLDGDAELNWQHDGQRYQATLRVSAPLRPARTQTSMGELGPDGLRPTRFGDRLRSEEATHFVRSGEGAPRIVFSRNAPDAVLLAGAQDRLSVMLQLAALIAGEPERHPVGSVIAVQTASTRDAEVWRFAIEAEETLSLPGGSQPALRLSRAPRHPYDQKVEVWLAPGVAHAPLRLRLTSHNGDTVDQRWASTDTP